MRPAQRFQSSSSSSSALSQFDDPEENQNPDKDEEPSAVERLTTVLRRMPAPETGGSPEIMAAALSTIRDERKFANHLKRKMAEEGQSEESLSKRFKALEDAMGQEEGIFGNQRIPITDEEKIQAIRDLEVFRDYPDQEKIARLARQVVTGISPATNVETGRDIYLSARDIGIPVGWMHERGRHHIDLYDRIAYAKNLIGGDWDLARSVVTGKDAFGVPTNPAILIRAFDLGLDNDHTRKAKYVPAPPTDILKGMFLVAKETAKSAYSKGAELYSQAKDIYSVVQPKAAELYSVVQPKAAELYTTVRPYIPETRGISRYLPGPGGGYQGPRQS